MKKVADCESVNYESVKDVTEDIVTLLCISYL